MNDFYEKFQEKQQAAGKIRFEHVEIDINDPKCTDKLSS